VVTEETSQGRESEAAELVGGEEQAWASTTNDEVLWGAMPIEEWLGELHSPLQGTARSFSRAGYTTGGQVGSLLRRTNGIFDQHTLSMVATTGGRAPTDKAIVLRARRELWDLLGQLEPCLTLFDLLVLMRAGGAVKQEAPMPAWVNTGAVVARAAAYI
jgi:hypothetical protein